MEGIKFSETIKELFTAVFEFNKKAGKIIKTEDNPFFKAKYADLSSVQEVVKPKLIDVGLVLTCWPVGDNYMTTMLVHVSSGEYVMTTFKLNIEPSYDKDKKETANGPVKSSEVTWRSEPYFDSQKWGAAVTYARRITIGAVLDLIIDKDNDGNKSGDKQENNKPWLNPNDENWEAAKKFLKDGNPIQKVYDQYQFTKTTKQKLMTEADV